MIKNIKDINILHWNGVAKNDEYKKWRLFHELSLRKIIKPGWLDIVTCFTNRSNAMLIDQLELSNIQYINATKNINKNLVKAFKPIYYYEAIKECNNEYVLITDSYDVTIINFDNIVEKLSIYDRQLIYNAQQYNFPMFNNEYDVGCPTNISYNKINSGVVFGKTKYIKAFYKEFSEYVTNNYNKDLFESQYEQYYLMNFLYNNLNTISIGVDYKLLSLIQCIGMNLDKDENNDMILDIEIY